MPDTYAAWHAALPGMWGIVLDHSPNHEPFGAYPTEAEAWQQVRVAEQAQPGVRGWVVRK